MDSKAFNKIANFVSYNAMKTNNYDLSKDDLFNIRLGKELDEYTMVHVVDYFINSRKIGFENALNDAISKLKLSRNEILMFADVNIQTGYTDMSIAFIRYYCNKYLAKTTEFNFYCIAFQTKEKIHKMYTRKSFSLISNADYDADCKYFAFDPLAKEYFYVTDEFVEDILIGIENRDSYKYLYIRG